MTASESPDQPVPALEPEVQQALDRARKLLGLAREQCDALERGSYSQFQWLVLRRQEVTDQLPRSIAPGAAIPGPAATELQSIREQLAQVDAAMQARVSGRMKEIKKLQGGLRRSRRMLQGYGAPPASSPRFIDGKS